MYYNNIAVYLMNWANKKMEKFSIDPKLSEQERKKAMEDFWTQYLKELDEFYDDLYTNADADLDRLNEIIKNERDKVIKKNPNMTAKEIYVRYPQIKQLELSEQEKAERERCMKGARNVLKRAHIRLRQVNEYDSMLKKYYETLEKNDPNNHVYWLNTFRSTFTVGSMIEKVYLEDANVAYKALKEKVKDPQSKATEEEKKAFDEQTEDRRQSARDVIKNMKEALAIFSKPMSDEEFLRNAEKYGNILIFSGEMERDGVKRVFEFLHVTPNKEDLALIEDFAQNYSDDLVSLCGSALQRLEFTASPVYMQMKLEDIARVSVSLSLGNDNDETLPDRLKIPAATQLTENGGMSLIRALEGKGDGAHSAEITKVGDPEISHFARISKENAKYDSYMVKNYDKYYFNEGLKNGKVYDQDGKPLKDYNAMFLTLIAGGRLNVLDAEGKFHQFSVHNFPIMMKEVTPFNLQNGRDQICNDIEQMEAKVADWEKSNDPFYQDLAETAKNFAKAPKPFYEDAKYFCDQLAELAKKAQKFLIEEQLKSGGDPEPSGKINFAKELVDKYTGFNVMYDLTEPNRNLNIDYNWTNDFNTPVTIIVREMRTLYNELVNKVEPRDYEEVYRAGDVERKKFKNDFHEKNKRYPEASDYEKVKFKVSEERMEKARKIIEESKKAKPVIAAHMVRMYCELFRAYNHQAQIAQGMEASILNVFKETVSLFGNDLIKKAIAYGANQNDFKNILNSKPETVYQNAFENISKRREAAELKKKENALKKEQDALKKEQDAPKKEQNEPQKEVNEPQKEVNEPQKEVNEPQKEVNAPQNEENVPQEEQNVPQEEQNVPQEEQNAPQEEQNVPQEEQPTGDIAAPYHRYFEIYGEAVPNVVEMHTKYRDILNDINVEYNNLLETSTLYAVTSDGKVVQVRYDRDAYLHFTDGSHLLFLNKDGNMAEIYADRDNPRLVNIDVPAKTMNIVGPGGRAEIAEFMENAVKNLGTINSFLWRPTKAFTKMADILEKLKKTDIYVHPESYMKQLQKAAQFAQEYLDAKKTDGKTRTDKTDKRIAFAKDILDRFEHIAVANKVAEAIPYDLYKDGKAPMSILLSNALTEFEEITDEGEKGKKPEEKHFKTILESDTAGLLKRIKDNGQRINQYVADKKAKNEEIQVGDKNMVPHFHSNAWKPVKANLQKNADFWEERKDYLPKLTKLYASLCRIASAKILNEKTIADYTKKENSYNNLMSRIGKKLLDWGVTEENMKSIMLMGPEQAEQLGVDIINRKIEEAKDAQKTYDELDKLRQIHYEAAKSNSQPQKQGEEVKQNNLKEAQIEADKLQKETDEVQKMLHEGFIAEKGAPEQQGTKSIDKTLQKEQGEMERSAE